MTVVFTLLVVILADAGPTSFSRDYRTEEACHFAEAFMRQQAEIALGVVDIGTLCVKSTLDQNRKPRV